ncbi:hypothetical protein PN499_11635 [Kamptonema animale CS-326]|uniref:hypothetical protein n=1 Tax=Kamptonema animale TaxID=92934 RepID=UPI00232BCC4A|nr:hypothetical protein [Kamptonema animale]MDB9511838.1 hypothetical protein [Kamptonema animale CS-326]
MPLIILAIALQLSFFLTEVLVLLPIGWLHWPPFPNWLSLTLIFLAMSWCLGD